jgi:lipopolysaccharide export system permease protein
VAAYRDWRRLSPTVDRFMMRSFLGPLFAATAAFVGVHVLINTLDRFNDVVVRGGALGIQYMLWQAPIGAVLLLPPTCLTAVLLAFGILNRSGELLAFQSVGVSRLQLAIPVLAMAAAVSMLDFILNETVVPIANLRSHDVLNVRIRKETRRGALVGNRLWIRERGGFLSVDLFDERRKRMEGVTLYHTDPRYGLRMVRYAKSAEWNGRNWMPSGLQAYNIADDGRVDLSASGEFAIEATPSEIGDLVIAPEELGLLDLQRFIDDLRSKGLDPGRFLVERDLRFARPFACLIMAALGVALSLDPVPRHSGLGRSFAGGIAVGFLYFLALGLTVSFGRSALIPSWVAAWVPNALFALLAVSIFLYGEER